ncbi:multimeric flavodoxin WrbA [Sphingomonas kaistensis]|uniref:Multimeric flavodoxin WrbA n=1 Tax=Sphingomonas kaistensis TaxID=298708 RepID=A0A7X5Y5S6_9SPHN|nr:NAD(P)H-dependent oxidoreductase [Sphingomonas kaistensis]NJC05117.1 multimeric flavodoxin WrbA [Sphingomonas kaistensis]
MVKAIAVNASLKASSGEPSSTDKMIGLVEHALAKRGAEWLGTIRLADHDIKPGVSSDEGEGDAWPALRKQILEADILVFGTPIWMGQLPSTAKRVLERMDAFLSETDDNGRMPSTGKVLAVAIVGNEDGAHHVSAELFQGLSDTGWTVPPGGPAYWVGEAMGKVDFKDLPKVPDKVTETVEMLASNSHHLATLLADKPFPGVEQSK